MNAFYESVSLLAEVATTQGAWAMIILAPHYLDPRFRWESSMFLLCCKLALDYVSDILTLASPLGLELCLLEGVVPSESGLD